MKLLLVIMFAMLAFNHSANAFPLLEKKLIDQYTVTVTDPAGQPQKKEPVVGCATCHSPMVKNGLNPYGMALLANFQSTKAWDFVALESTDADGDGVNSGDEIKAGTNPGSQTKMNGPYTMEPFVFTTKAMGTVTFNHDAHSMGDAYGVKGQCNLCHGTEADAPNTFFPKLFDDRLAMKDISHKLCKDCHTANPSSPAPVKCLDCHKK